MKKTKNSNKSRNTRHSGAGHSHSSVHRQTSLAILLFCLVLALFFSGDARAWFCEYLGDLTQAVQSGSAWDGDRASGVPDLEQFAASLPSFEGEPCLELNDNVPYFTSEDVVSKAYCRLSKLDALGRCGMASACFGPETVAEGERGSISHVRPSGWQTAKYDSVNGRYLYNRCHLLMWKLSGILDDKRNLITGTRYMNTEGMLPYEEIVLDYVEDEGGHVMYRVTPVFVGEELVARGVLLEALSVEDRGSSICFCVYCFNVQPGIDIDYATGESDRIE